MTDKFIFDLMEQYTKEEMLELCSELSLTVADTIKAVDVAQFIINDLDENGIPSSNESSELMGDFLYVANYVDEDGEIIDLDEEDDEEEVVEVEEETRIPKLVPTPVGTDINIDRLPECYGFHDDRDPACRKCKIKVSCEDERIKTRPECFGSLYHKNNIQCKNCIERTFCEEVMNG